MEINPAGLESSGSMLLSGEGARHGRAADRDGDDVEAAVGV